MSEPGTVTIKLGEEEVVLTPSLVVAQAVSRYCEGYTEAFRKVGAVDLDAITFIVAEGMGKSDARSRKEVANRIYEAGVVNLAGPVSQFLSLLVNGGKPAADGPATSA